MGKPDEKLELERGRSVTTGSDGANQTVEIRGADGAVELRIKITDDGPVLVLEGAKVEINAADTIAMSCKSFEVAASERLDLGSDGELAVKSKGELTVESEDECFVRGKMIWLN